MSDQQPPYKVFVVSDGTGGTARRVVLAALAQFEADADVIRFADIRTVEQVEETVRQAAGCRALVVHTLVRPEMRQAMFDAGRRLHVHTLDLMGPLLERLSDLTDVPPLGRPGLYGQEEYSRRIEAVDFALRHDDGKYVSELEHAEIVLVGASRTGKTPLAVYLALRGWLVGNVPVVLGVKPPSILFRLPASRVIGLTERPARLAELRRARADQLRGRVGRYAEPTYVQEEVAYALQIFRRAGWRWVDMTSKPIEEAAAEVADLVGDL
jgi:regulator of PEP synthase PpsR (kinase-PPPase family)